MVSYNRGYRRIYAADIAADRLIAAGQEAVPAVAHLGIHSQNPQIRFMSMKVLGVIGGKKYASEILDVLHGEHDQRVLVCGAEALCLFGKREYAIPIVKDVLVPSYGPDDFVGYNDDFRSYCFTKGRTPVELAEYLNRRFKLGIEVPAQVYRYIKPVDEDRYPRAKK
jgi:hypothetical protein